MSPYLFLWCVSLSVVLWNGLLLGYYYLPRNDVGDRYIPGWNIIPGEMCGLRLAGVGNMWGFIIVILPAAVEMVLLGLSLSSIVMCLVAMQREFSVLILTLSSTYDGIYEVFFNLTTFYATFSTTAPGSTYSPCLESSPVAVLKATVAMCVLVFPAQCVASWVCAIAYQLCI